MDCLTCKDKIYEYLYEILDEAERAEFEGHLALCADCRQMSARAQKAVSRLGYWKVEAPSAGMPEKILRCASSSQRHPRMLLLRWPALAAALLLAFALWMPVGSRVSEKREELAAANPRKQAPDERFDSFPEQAMSIAPLAPEAAGPRQESLTPIESEAANPSAEWDSGSACAEICQEEKECDQGTCSPPCDAPWAMASDSAVGGNAGFLAESIEVPSPKAPALFARRAMRTTARSSREESSANRAGLRPKASAREASGASAALPSAAGDAEAAKSSAQVHLREEREEENLEDSFCEAVDRPRSEVPLRVDTSSYLLCRDAIGEGRIPVRSEIRAEAFINHFHYEYPEPSSGEDFSVTTELATCPWNTSRFLLHIGLRGKEAPGFPVIAQDARACVDFNPSYIRAYRLIGFENNPAEIQESGEEIRAGHRITVLYEVVPESRERILDRRNFWAMRKQVRADASLEAQAENLLILRLSYLAPGTLSPRMVSGNVNRASVYGRPPSRNLEWSAAAAGFAMLLAGSERPSNLSYELVMELAESSNFEEERGSRAEFLQLVARARELKK